MHARLEQLKVRLQEASDLESASALMYWDQATYMPPGAAAARGRQMALLDKMVHEKLTDPAIGKLLDELEPWAESLPDDSDEARLVRVTRREYERKVKVPAALLGELSEHGSASYQAWTQARPDNDFARMQPFLEKTLDLSRKLADCFPGYEHIADPLIDFADYGMTAASLRVLFSELRRELVPLVEAITAQEPADDACLHHHYPEAQQLAFGEEVIRRLGYDFQHGRQDKTHHPFEIPIAPGDVRITTRLKENDISDALMSTIHEAGHGMYEQGIDPAFASTPLAHGTSSGVHESQSRLWENVVGRSRGFWAYFYPRLQAEFPGQLGGTDLDTFYRAINKVQRSLIRTDADEVTYNLHVIIRFDLELQMLEGKLAIKDLPETWQARYLADIGVQSPDNRDGVLQDVHWYGGVIGGSFQGYTLGNVLAAQFYAAALHARPDIPEQIRQGEFGRLHGWLQENIYRHGKKYTTGELVERVTGGPLQIEPYIRYLRTKFGELYTLPE